MKHNYYNTLPSEIRTLLKAPRYHNVIKIDPGEYIHCGIKLSLYKVIRDMNIKPSVSLDVDYFIDKLQISRSSRRGLMIILEQGWLEPEPESKNPLEFWFFFKNPNPNL
jgi:hypothetical protein